MSVIVSIDLETSSTCDLKKWGSIAYANDPSTVVLMFCWHVVGSSAPIATWHMGEPFPPELARLIAEGALLSGWKVITFDRLVWAAQGVPRHGFPPVPDGNWLDSMYVASAANVPRSLAGAAKFMRVDFVEDLKDQNQIRRITDQSRTPLPLTYADRTWLADRCVQDVAMEEQVLVRLPSWPTAEPWSRIPEVDRRVNDRGILMDVPLVQGLAHVAQLETKRLDREMAKLTGGKVPATTNIEKLKLWLMENGVELPRKDAKPKDEDEQQDNDLVDDTGGEKETETAYRLRKSDIADLLARTDVPDHCRQALAWRAEAAKASAKKLVAMLKSASPDGRLRGALILGGAQATMRWSGSIWQPHNFVRDVIANPDEVAAANKLDDKKHKDIVMREVAKSLTCAIEAGRSGDPQLIEMLFGANRKDLQGRPYYDGVLPFVSRMLRRTLTAPQGYVFLNGDFANIEARIPVWLAGQQNMVDAFACGVDVYRLDAAPVYKQTPESLTKSQRQVGKVMRLFLGFAGGVNAFIPAAMNYGLAIDREFGQKVVTTFREENVQLVAFWDELLNCAVKAVQFPGWEFPVAPLGLVSWKLVENCLLCKLPSGRYLRYWSPRLEQGYWDEEKTQPKKKLDLTVLFVKGRAVFRRTLWRGLAVENCLSETARVVTSNGVKRIAEVTLADRVWDGISWVQHGGVIQKGMRETLCFGGVRMTPDHKVDVDGVWRESGHATYGEAATSYARHYRAPDWTVAGSEVPRDQRAPRGVVDTLRLRDREADAASQVLGGWGDVLRLSQGRSQANAPARAADARPVQASCVRGLALNAGSLPVADAPRLRSLRRSRNSGLREMADVRDVLGGYGPDISGGVDFGAERQRQRLQSGELRLGDAASASAQYASEHHARNTLGVDDGWRSGRQGGDQPDHDLLSDSARRADVAAVGSARCYEPVLDILNAGPNHRFTVVGRDGRYVLVSNCTQAIAADLLATALDNMDRHGELPVVLHVHDNAVAEVREDDADRLLPIFKAAMLDAPAWTKGLPLDAAVAAETRFS